MAIKTMLRLFTAMSIGLLVASCQDDMQSGLGSGTKHLRPLKPETIALMDSKGMRKEDPILVRTFKQENTLEIWKRDKSGRFALLKSYPMCSWGGTLGPKIREGDKQSPEGFYTVTPARMNPNSQFFLAYDVGYPNAFDRAWGRTGAAVMVHGNCTGSAGCFVMTDAQVEEIYGLAREAFNGGQKSFQVQSFPFHMTAENLAKNRKNPNLAFWKQIKKGYDHFEVTKLEPKVDVCDKHYVFDARATDPNSTTFNATGACPTYDVPSEIKVAVAEKEASDEKAFKVAVADLEDQARHDQDKARRMEERAVADAREKAKPQPGTEIAAWLGAPPASQSEVADFSVAGLPIAAPLPKPSPKSFTATQVAAAEASPAAPASPGGITGSLFSFGARRAPADPAAAAVQPTSGDDKPLWKKINPFGG
ncbi:L,D-transpeptidase family protein [Pinisolibacter aquiterrae]|uniref:L,D-transpeptidase family protein n=1 Tax=Pinisolibacter aquiterrae TaxID=2815579 RepID=UPI001C3E73F7|nr:murein L,D-transpeptidase family protein [Pinisolibacter aquiterrae]MBV5262775.1 murein L,D-transpeptidase [Pinisolibacter aquiterrae]MCC8233595.1 L,D-transpeptidase family protein [Pinisolibacter aquiterrae]